MAIIAQYPILFCPITSLVMRCALTAHIMIVVTMLTPAPNASPAGIDVALPVSFLSDTMSLSPFVTSYALNAKKEPGQTQVCPGD